MKKSQAFTILEFCLTISILAIIILAGFPIFTDIVKQNRVLAQAFTIKTALQIARSEAVSRHEQIIFCGTKNGKECDGNWSNGQIIKNKSNRILHVFSEIPKQDRLVWKSSLGKNNELIFLPSGMTNGQQGSFYYYPYNYSKGNVAIVINQTGRVRIRFSM